MRKSTRKILVTLLAIFFIASSCNFVGDAKTKFARYCPGLKINTAGISYAYSNGKTFYVISYDQSSQKEVKTYFEKKENGFGENKDSDLYDLKFNDDPAIDKSDNILTKTIKHRKGSTVVVFNETTRRILIIDNDD